MWETQGVEKGGVEEEEMKSWYGDSMKALKAGPSSFKSIRNRDSRNLNVNCLLDFHVKHLYPLLWLRLDDVSLLMNITMSQLCAMESLY